MNRSTATARERRGSHAERSAATQQRLIATAIEVIQSRSLEEMSIHELARKAGMTSGAVQHHFESKAALMMRVLSELIAADDHTGGLWPSAEQPVDQRAQQFVQAIWQLVYAQPRFVAAWNVYLGSRHQPDIMAHVAELRQAVNQRMREGFLTAFPELQNDPGRDGFRGLIFSTLRGLGLLTLFPAESQNTQAQLDCLAGLIAARCQAAVAAPRHTDAAAPERT